MTLKELIELRNEKIEKIKEFKTIAETRSITEGENTEFEELKKEIAELDSRIEILEVEEREIVNTEVDKLDVSQELREFLKNPTLDLRAFGAGVGNNFKAAEAGAIIPQTLSDRIIEKILQESNILPLLTRYDITGELLIPKFDASTITINFYDEFADTVESNAKFTNVKLSTFRISGLLRISKKLINNVNFDIESFLINKIAEQFRLFLEKSVVVGSAGKFDSLFTAEVGNTITLAKKDEYSINDLIDLQAKLPTVHQSTAVFVMNKEMLTILRKLQDKEGRYYVLPDVTRGFGFQILDTAIQVTDFAPAGQVLYANVSEYGLAVSEEMNIQVLNELYATQHAVGINIHGQFGGKITDEQAFALLKNKE
ncbi:MULTISPECIES: phage major capsid protein [Gemella]|uniref:phage major capsid protein n=1 Tax=Gemella TaxID=1378 RepID=UPI0009306DB3|nr:MULTISPECIES: phage major capsid protein [Gemella]AXI27266.1 phage major capsid protein [Gemella sp. ND 6198]